MQRRFLADPRLRSVELLLQERVPLAKPVYPHAAEAEEVRPRGRQDRRRRCGCFDTPDTAGAGGASAEQRPVHGDGDGGRGAGTATCDGLALTRWREDVTAGRLRDVRLPEGRDRRVRSGGATLPADRGRAAELRRSCSAKPAPSTAARDGDMRDLHDRSASARRTTSSCGGSSCATTAASRRTIEVTSFAEVVLNEPAAEKAHPAFSNLFVQTEILHDRQAILVQAPPAQGGRAPAGDGPFDDRARVSVVGGGRELRDRPLGVPGPRPDGRRPGGAAHPEFGRFAGERARPVRGDPPPRRARARRAGGGRSDHRRRPDPRGGRSSSPSVYRDPAIVGRIPDRGVEPLGHHAPAARHHRGRRAALRPAGRERRLRRPRPAAPAPRSIAANRKGQSGLWGFGISGDLPIVLLKVRRPRQAQDRRPARPAPTATGAARGCGATSWC